ncbi:PAS domain S-box protein [Candidatus Halobeggiatoa sp. HSG11]|nr:PAS domain S-box protein [Candidatus Halobeggiatoa sp. HSG11]
MLISFTLNQKIRRFLVTYLLLLLPIIAIGATIYYAEVKTNKISLETQVTENLQGQFKLILTEFKHIISDLLFLSEHNEIQDLLNTNNENAKQNLATEYLNLVTHKKIYDQIRFLDKTGLEIVRANFNKDKSFIVPEEKLQNKGGRYYFKDSLTLKRGEIFISPFDLNMERGQIEQPLKPMLRFGTPIFDQHGNKRGVTLLNYLGKNLLNQMRQLAIKNFSDIMLLNKNGFWLLSSNRDDEWGFMSEQGKDKTFGNRFPDEWQTINNQKSGQLSTANGLFTFTTIYPLANKYKEKIHIVGEINDSKILEFYWKLVSYIPPTALTTNSTQILANMTLPFIGLMVLMLFIALILTYIGIRHAEAKAFLQHNEEQLRLLIEGVVDYAIIMINAQGKIVSWNSGAERISYYTADEIIGKHLSIFHTTENIKNGKVEQILTEAVKQGKTEDEGYRIRKNGSKYWARVTITALHKPDGTLRGFTHVTRDITERRNAEENTRQNEMMFRTIYESSSDAIMLLDENGFFDCNSITLTMFGCDTKEQFISHHPSEFSPPNQPNGEDSKTLADKYIQATIKKGSCSFEWLHCRLDGTNFYAEILLNSLKLHDWPVLQAVVRDITERKQAEEKIKLANEQIHKLNEQLLSENQRMSAKLEITRQLQQMMLPKEQELCNIKYLDVAGFMEPAETVGGDYYDVLQYGEHVLFAIGDVTGHGLESGVLAIMVQTAVRTILSHNETTDLAKFLNTLNDVIYSNVQRMNSDKNLTFMLLDYEPTNFPIHSKSEDIKGILCLSGQHETIIVVRTNGDIEDIDTIDLGFPIGLEADVSEWITQTSISLKVGDVVALYTDGITEAENCAKEFYGLERLSNVIQKNRHLNAESIRYAVIYDVLQFIDGQKVYDDITLLILKQK